MVKRFPFMCLCVKSVIPEHFWKNSKGTSSAEFTWLDRNWIIKVSVFLCECVRLLWDYFTLWLYRAASLKHLSSERGQWASHSGEALSSRLIEAGVNSCVTLEIKSKGGWGVQSQWLLSVGVSCIEKSYPSWAEGQRSLPPWGRNGSVPLNFRETDAEETQNKLSE